MSTKLFPRLQDKKIQTLMEGIDILDSWLDQLVVKGFRQLSVNESILEEISTRMSDYGLIGIARKLRVFPEKIKKDKDWLEFMAEFVAEMKFFINACKSKTPNKFHPEDMLTYAGISIKKTEVIAASNGIVDQWIFLGSRIEKEESLSIIRNWFIGRNTNKIALFIDFQVGRFLSPSFFEHNCEYSDTIHFYPSAVPLRCTEISKQNKKRIDRLSMPSITVQAMLDQIANNLLSSPWINHQFFIVNCAHFAIHQEKLYFIDSDGEGLQCINDRTQWIQLISLSGVSTILFGIEVIGKTCLVYSSIYNHSVQYLKQ